MKCRSWSVGDGNSGDSQEESVGGSEQLCVCVNGGFGVESDSSV